MYIRERLAMPPAKKPWLTTLASPLLGWPWDLAGSTPKGFGQSTKLEHRSVGKPSVFASWALNMPVRFVEDLPVITLFLRLQIVQVLRAKMEICGYTPEPFMPLRCSSELGTLEVEG